MTVVMAVSFAACDSGDDDDSATSTSAPNGQSTVTDQGFAARQYEYLLSAGAPMDPNSPLSVIASAELARRDQSYTFDASKVGPDAFERIFTRIDEFADTTDFDVLYLLNLWYGYQDELPQATQDAMREHFLKFKYWYTEPTPEGIVDNKYYWSENHRIIFHVDEYLAGLAFPDETFTNDGRTGKEHAEEAQQRILTWLDEKVRFGFTEWHSDVYYQKDVTPLLSLVEFAPDEDLANRAGMMLDVFLLDIATHLQRGTFGVTHGRSYMKDKSIATDEDTFALSKLLFDDTSLPYNEGADAGATLFARAENFALAPVIGAIATSEETTVDQEHMNVPLDPSAPVDPNVVAPYGYDFDDPDNVPFWWERGAQTVWQEVPMTIQTLDEYNLWDSEFFSPFKPLRDAVGSDMAGAQNLAQTLAPQLAFGLLAEVNTYTYRAPNVMLSTAQDYRPGVFSEQIQSWQATLDERALVFTTHPKNEPESGTEWPDSDGYWTGTGSMPRSAQHGTVSVNIYSPTYTPTGPPLDAFGYLDYTHAYFPQEYFDEVVQEGNWTFGRKGDGYVALWSQRPPTWREHDPNVVFTHGLTRPFDLVAMGGAQNVWIAEVGDAAKWETFDAFKAAITAAPVTVDADLNVDYTSPTEGHMRFGSTGPLTVNDTEVDLHPTARIDNPFVTVPFEGKTYEIKAGDDTLTLDFANWKRMQ
ncbi:MAG TPA: hypothetical protein VFX21_13135 [Acidimicrobiia bacterium]|nr:hypothetical protein [Acidimicrobiia bacterium]